MMMIHEPAKVDYTIAVIGCGVIGTSWAALFSSYGYTVRLWDAAPGWQQRVDAPIAAAKSQLRDLGISGDGRLVYCPTLEAAVAGAGWVQESTPESLDVKRSVFADIGAHAPRAAIIASSTSSFTWTSLAGFMFDPSRLVTAHPFNPPHLMPLVEVYASTDLVAAHALGFFRGIGRRPIRLRIDATGHVANRLASALWREAVHIVASGIADVADVDAAVVDGPGLRWSTVGPHMAYHLGGGTGGIRNYLQHLGDSQVRRWADLGSPTLSDDVREAIAKGVEREAAGRSVDVLAHDRDALLIATLRARKALQQCE